MAKQQSLEMRDTRKKGFFIVDDLFVNEWARKLGPHACMVYIALCRHSDKEQRAWPSITLLGRELKISRRQVMRAIDKLHSFSIINIEHLGGRTNRYVLTDRTTWHESDTSDFQSLVTPSHQCHTVTTLVTPSHHPSYIGLKDTQEGNTLLRARFDEFWKAYPKKRSKGQAEKAWQSIRPDEQLIATILAAVERAKTSGGWQEKGGKYIPYPATWLNAKGWEDELGDANGAGPQRVPMKIAPRPERRAVARVDEGPVGLKEILDRVMISRGSNEAQP